MLLGRRKARATDRVMEFQDKVLRCVDCGKDFIFTAGEQLFFHDKQFHNDPKRCKACKLKRGGGSSVRAETRTHCSVCGQETTVPFRPTQGRPVLCRSCFETNRRASPAPQTTATAVSVSTSLTPAAAASLDGASMGGGASMGAAALPDTIESRVVAPEATVGLR